VKGSCKEENEPSGCIRFVSRVEEPPVAQEGPHSVELLNCLCLISA
jgi:hypothetical protein